jgi:hypothetical protein
LANEGKQDLLFGLRRRANQRGLNRFTLDTVEREFFAHIVLGALPTQPKPVA